MTETKVNRYLREYDKLDGLIGEYPLVFSSEDLEYFKDIFEVEEDTNLVLNYPILYQEERDYLLSIGLPFDIFNTEQCDYFLEADVT